MEKKDFLKKLKSHDVGDDFRKKSAPMIERLFEKGVDDKSRKLGMDAVLKIYRNQAAFKKSADRLAESLKKAAVKKRKFRLR